MSDYNTIDSIESATVTTIIPYSGGAEIREHDMDTMGELMEFIHTVDNPAVAERIINVDIRERCEI